MIIVLYMYLVNYYIKNIQNENKPIVFLMIGGPGSGKSTIKKKILEKFDYNISNFVDLDPDQILKDLYKNKIEKEQTLSIYDCISCFSQEETLDGDEKWYCSKCKDHVKAIKKLQIYKKQQNLIFNHDHPL